MRIAAASLAFCFLSVPVFAQPLDPTRDFVMRPIPREQQRVIEFNGSNMAAINARISGRYDGEIIADIARPGRFLFRYGGTYRVNPDGSQTLIERFAVDIAPGDCLRVIDEDPGEIGDLVVIPAAEC